MNTSRVVTRGALAAAQVCIVAAAAGLAGAAAAQALLDDLAWAYAITPGPAAPAAPAAPDDGVQRTLAGAERTFTRTQAQNRFGPADWFPNDHPAMPPIVAEGRQAGGVWACSLCHYPNGRGRPENAGVAGLPVPYFMQQLQDFKDGVRQSAQPLKANTVLMAGFAHAMTDDEMRQAAGYFAKIAWTPWINVVETDTVPKTRIAGGMHLKLDGPGAGTEPLGNRIVESPLDAEQTEQLRNPRSGFTAYVPKGSVARGQKLAATGGGKTTACTVCHGQDLAGLAVIPPLRGRSPSYIARQLVDFKQGTRHGLWAPLMGPVVANLTADDILVLAAYLASLPAAPPAASH
jgi:cytochrome c553